MQQPLLKVTMLTRVIAVMLLAGSIGCAAGVWYGNPLRLHARTFSVGMTKQQVQSLAGLPQQVVTKEFQGVMVETWKYLDKTVTFHNGLLHSWVNVGVSRDKL